MSYQISSFFRNQTPCWIWWELNEPWQVDPFPAHCTPKWDLLSLSSLYDDYLIYFRTVSQFRPNVWSQSAADGDPCISRSDRHSCPYGLPAPTCQASGRGPSARSAWSSLPPSAASHVALGLPAPGRPDSATEATLGASLLQRPRLPHQLGPPVSKQWR